MLNSKTANTSFRILDVIKNRWSPVGFDNTKPVEKEKIDILLEAARWAPSSFNEQPWSYIIGYKGDETHEKLAGCLVEGNSWAKDVYVLMLSIAKNFFEHQHKANRFHMHDTGAANACMHLQATAENLGMHQMEGFNVEQARKYFNINKDYTPASMIAIGYPAASTENLPEQLKQRDESERGRKPHEDLLWEF